MSKVDNGGPAFPTPQEQLPMGTHFEDLRGMTLRDWFAGMALQAIISRPDWSEWTARHIAMEAYEYAAAMLAARRKAGQ